MGVKAPFCSQCVQVLSTGHHPDHESSPSLLTQTDILSLAGKPGSWRSPISSVNCMTMILVLQRILFTLASFVPFAGRTLAGTTTAGCLALPATAGQQSQHPRRQQHHRQKASRGGRWCIILCRSL